MNDTLTYKLLSLSDKKQWKESLNQLPEKMQDVYFSPEYYELYEKNGDGKAYCFVYEYEGKLALYPFLMNKINNLGYELNNDYYDIQGAYGYNGVVYSSDDQDFIIKFYNEFNEFCKERNIIAEFTRFHPILMNHKFSEGFLNVTFNRQTVYFDLSSGYEFIYNNYGKKLRRALRNAVENDITTKVFENDPKYLMDFVEMYSETMNKVCADKYYRFNYEYFINLVFNNPVWQLVVFKGNIPIASSLCLYSKYVFHGHLAASRKDFLSLHPNEVLFDAQVRCAIEEKKKICHIGGGRTTAENDSLLQFKKHFSNTLYNFYIGTKVYNADVFNSLIDQWEKRYPKQKDAYQNHFLKYRNLLPKI